MRPRDRTAVDQAWGGRELDLSCEGVAGKEEVYFLAGAG